MLNPIPAVRNSGHWSEHCHLLTPEQIRHMLAWETPTPLEQQFLAQFPDPAAAHRSRLVTHARDIYGAMGPGGLN